MIRVISVGDDEHRLEDDAGAHLGWIRGRALGFHGMRSEAQAMAAVAAAWRPFDGALRRHYSGWPPDEVSLDGLRTVHDGAYEWVSDGRRPLARLYRPSAAGGGLSIEFVLPTYANEGVVISVAQVVARALVPHLDAAARRAVAGRSPVSSVVASPALAH